MHWHVTDVENDHIMCCGATSWTLDDISPLVLCSWWSRAYVVWQKLRNSGKWMLKEMIYSNCNLYAWGLENDIEGQVKSRMNTRVPLKSRTLLNRLNGSHPSQAAVSSLRWIHLVLGRGVQGWLPIQIFDHLWSIWLRLFEPIGCFRTSVSLFLFVLADFSHYLHLFTYGKTLTGCRKWWAILQALHRCPKGHLPG